MGVTESTQRIEGFTDLTELYRGRKSLIYRGRDALGRPIVLKTLRADAADVNEIARFRHECEIAQQLSDIDEIVATLRVERQGDVPVMVLDDFGGESLRAAVSGKPLSPKEFLDVAIPIVRALTAIHDRDIVHKDLNANNVLVNRETGTVKVIDFGLASRLSRENQAAVSPHLLEGTLAYMAPEQTGRMNRAIDYRTDFYSLGVTFYEMLTGDLPFTTTDAMELVHC